MIKAISDFFVKTVGARLCVFFCSMIPIIELRGSIPLGYGMGLGWVETFILSVIGNMLPVPLILIFIKAILKWMCGCRVKWISRFGNWIVKKGEKNKGKVEKYSFWGLFLFVAIPIPGTGAWTGSLVAALVNIKFPKALLAIFLGVLCAGVIMTLISYGAIAALVSLF